MVTVPVWVVIVPAKAIARSAAEPLNAPLATLRVMVPVVALLIALS